MKEIRDAEVHAPDRNRPIDVYCRHRDRLAVRTLALRPPENPAKPKLSAPAQNPGFTPPNGWKKIDVGDKASLYLPHDMEPTRGLEESAVYRAIFSDASIRVTISYGEQLCSLTDSHRGLPSYSESPLEVNGKNAQFGIDRYYEPKLTILYLCFPSLDNGPSQLRLAVVCKGPEAVETARQIFKSVKFK